GVSPPSAPCGGLPRRAHSYWVRLEDSASVLTSFRLGDLSKSVVKKVFTLRPKDTVPSRTLSHALVALGLAASPASLIFSPATSAPPVTVLPTPLAVSSTP